MISFKRLKRNKELSEIMKGDNNPAKRPEVRKKIGLKSKGRKSTLGKHWKVKDTSKMSKSQKGSKKPWLVEIRKTKIGEKSSNYKGGLSPKYRIKNAPRPMPKQCEICGAFGSDFKRRLCFDHCHKTGKFRGWLCMRCNLAIGFVKDDIEILIKIIEYIKKNQ